MSPKFGPDWRKLAEAQKVEISDETLVRLEALSKAMLGMRGLVDWKEEPALSFHAGDATEEQS
jgi:hypothetical protein